MRVIDYIMLAVGRGSRFVWSSVFTVIVLLLMFCSGSVGAEGFRISATRLAAEDIGLKFAAQTDNYYQVWTRGCLTEGSWSVVDLELGQDGSQTWTNSQVLLRTNVCFYRVKSVLVSNPADVDEDGITDIDGWVILSSIL